MIATRVHKSHSRFLSILITFILDVYKSFDLRVCITEVKERVCNDNTKFPQKQGKILLMPILLKMLVAIGYQFELLN